jgi:hypothetical protein
MIFSPYVSTTTEVSAMTVLASAPARVFRVTTAALSIVVAETLSG